jgi:chemotaxis protein CheC
MSAAPPRARLTMRRARQLEAVHRAILMGIAQAAEQLSAFTNQQIEMGSPRLGLCAVEDLVSCTLGSTFDEVPSSEAEQIRTGIYLTTDGDVPGHFLMLLSPADALALVEPLLRDISPELVNREDLIVSALGEVGNITASSLLNALADATQLRIFPSCPAVVTDMAGAILEMPLLDIAQVANEALYIETPIFLSTIATTIAPAVIPRPEGLETLIQGLAAAQHLARQRKKESDD